MIRAAELAIFVAPLLALLLWRLALARGMQAPPPRQLLVLLAALAIIEAALITIALHDRLPPGRYVPPELRDGRIVPGHTE